MSLSNGGLDRSNVRERGKGENPSSVDGHSKPSVKDAFADNGEKESASRSLVAKLVAVVAGVTWMVVSGGLIILNKNIMSVDEFKYPMTLSGLGMGFSSVASFLACRVFKVVQEKAVTKEGKSMITWQFYAIRIMPAGFLMAATLAFGNMVYLYLSVSFIQILKAFTPVITMLFLFVAGLEKPTQRLIVSVLVIAVGTAVSSVGEVNLSVMGVVIMMLSEATEALRLVLTQLVLIGLKFHPVEGLMYFAPACCFWLSIGIALFEYNALIANNAMEIVARAPLKYFLAGCMGFLVNSLAYAVIVLASSLTLKVLGTVKNTLVVSAGVVLFGDVVTLSQGIGYVGSMVGFVWYNKIKMEEIGQKELARKSSKEVIKDVEQGEGESDQKASNAQ